MPMPPHSGTIHNTGPPQSYPSPHIPQPPPLPGQIAPGFVPHSQSVYIPPQSGGVGAPAYGASYIPPPPP